MDEDYFLHVEDIDLVYVSKNKWVNSIFSTSFRDP